MSYEATLTTKVQDLNDLKKRIISTTGEGMLQHSWLEIGHHLDVLCAINEVIGKCSDVFK